MIKHTYNPMGYEMRLEEMTRIADHFLGDRFVVVEKKESMDMDLIRDISLSIETYGDLYKQRTLPIINNLARKKLSGKYDADLAVKAFMYLAVDGIKKYKKEMEVDAVLSKEAKEWIAKDLLDTYSEHIDEVVEELKSKKK